MQHMHWQEEKQKQTKTSDKVTNISFKIDCRSLPLDHSWVLQEALEKALPWLVDEPLAAIHDIHGAESGNGWIRPSDNDTVLYLSRRTRLRLRLPTHRVDAAKHLENQELKLANHSLIVGISSLSPLTEHKTLFARYLLDNDTDEDAFLDTVMGLLTDKGIQPPRVMSGKQHTIYTPKGNIRTRSVMIDGLEPMSSLLLQEEGIGGQRRLGCDICLPHKGIDAVYKID